MKKINPLNIGIWMFYLVTVAIVAMTGPNSLAFAVAAGLALILLVLIGPPVPLTRDKGQE